jgi:hypothetical protein
MNKRNTQDGFIVRILLIIVALVAIKYYYHFDVLAYLKTPEAQKVIGPVWNAIKAVYFWVDGLFKNHLSK